jgi:uncharacterized glyoxalase superfamily protein PhnB
MAFLASRLSRRGGFFMSSTSEVQASSEPLDAHDLAASLTVRDLERSFAWYRDALGFTLDRKHERGGKLIAISLKAGTARVLLTQDDGAKGERTKGEGFSLQLSTTQNADGLAARARSAGALLDTEPTDMPWGPRVFRLRDPDGFRWVVSSMPKPGGSP